MKATTKDLPASALDLMKELSPQEREAVMENAVMRLIPRGEIIVHQGDEADRVYYVLRGKFEVLRDRNHVVAEIGPGEPIGEIAFFAGLTRTADVIALRDSDVIELDREAYDKISRSVPAFTRMILRSFGRRLAAATSTAPSLALRIAGAIGICAAGSRPMPQAFVEGLCSELSKLGHGTPIRHSDLPADHATLDDRAVTEWLAMRERELGRLLLVTGEGNARWDRLALRQCDFLLLCGYGPEGRDGPVPRNPLEDFALPLFRAEHVGLALWREKDSEPIRDTINWLGNRSLQLHHHIALDTDRDVARLARFLSGKALGMVLGGGGALGAAHLGTLRALIDAGARIDLFGGTSIGSSVALEMARNPGSADRIDHFEAFFLRRRALSKLTLPLYSVFDSHHFDRELRQEFGDSLIEDLPLNAFAVASNLSTHEVVVQRRGLCWRAVRASAAIPAALPPLVTESGEVLIDGAIMDNVPVSQMRRLKSGPNIAVILSPEDDWRISRRHDSLPSRRRLAGELALRRHDGGDFPKIIEVVGRAMMVANSRVMRQISVHGDLLLEPPSVPGMGLLDWKHIRAQETAAYEYTMALLDKAGNFEALLAGQTVEDGDGD